MITSFHGNYRFLSNFFYSPIRFEGAIYSTVEHAYQAAKTLDPYQRLMLQQPTHAAEAKRLGRRVTIRPDWEQIKLQVMENLLRDKFTTYQHLAQALLQTGNEELVEGNTWGDRFWGVCRGQGQNHLGKLLMRIRSEIRAIKPLGEGINRSNWQTMQFDYPPGSLEGQRIA